MTELWSALVSTALLGTERSSAPAPSLGEGALGTALASVDAASHGTEHVILMRASMLRVYERAGRRSAVGHAHVLDPAPPDVEPVCPTAAALRLERMLSGDHSELLPEWLMLAAERGMRVPPRLLVRLLDSGTAHREIRRDIRPVLGARGRWLASLRDDWRWASVSMATADGNAEGWSSELVEQFHTGAPLERVVAFTLLRRLDADRARELLEAGWDAEAPDDRPQFVKAIGESLVETDEPFLEAALADRRKTVRTPSAHLLSRLPSSRLGSRMADRLAPLVTVSSGNAGSARRRLLVEAPGELAKDAERDGLQPTPPRGTGPRSWWLRQLVARTPLDWWLTTTGVATPDDVVGLTLDGDFGDDVRAGWLDATTAQQRTDWAIAMAAQWPAGEAAGVVHLLPEASLQRWLTEHMRKLGFGPPVQQALHACEAPLPAELSRVVLREAVLRSTTATTSVELVPRWVQHDLPRLLHPDVLPEAVAQLRDAASAGADTNHGLASAIVAAVDQLTFRSELRLELLAPSEGISP